MKEKAKNSSYKWVIPFASLFIMVVVVGIIYNTFAVFTIPVTGDLKINRQSFSLTQTLIFLSTIFINPFISKLTKKYGLIRLLKVFSLITPVIYLGFALASAIWQFYLIAVFLGIAHCFVGMVPLSILLNEWFSENIGLAMGITFMGSGVGGMIFNPIANTVMEAYNWRYAFGFLGLVMMVVIVPICFFILKLPEITTDDDYWPANDALPLKAHAASSLSPLEPGAKESLSTPLFQDRRFWLLSIAFALNGIAGYSIISFITPHFRDLGYSSFYAANVMSLSMGLLAIGKVVLGAIYDRTSTRFATLFAIFASLIGLMAMYYAQYQWALAALAFGNLFGSPSGTVSQPLITKALFKPEDYGSANSIFVSFNNIGIAICPFFGSAVFDSSGSYRPAYLIMAGVMIICFFIFCLAIPKRDNYGKAGI